MKIKGTKILRSLCENSKDVAVLEGSSRSSKTFSILQYLIMEAVKNLGLTVRSFRLDQTTCRKTLVPDFLWLMREQFRDIWEAGKFNKSEAVFTYANGSQHYFDGCEVDKLHGLRQDIAHLNEAMEIGYDAWVQIAARTTKLKVIDYNPSLTQHWAFDKILRRGDEVFYHHSTFRDNPFLAEAQIKEIEGWEPTFDNKRRGTADKYKWEVYGLGKRGRQDGTIYTRWEITEDWPDKMACQRYGYGLDFGFSIDPTALIECAFCQDILYIRERIYETGLCAVQSESNPKFASIESRLKELGVDKHAKIFADCAQPDSIAELSGVGYNVIACHKVPGSINSGIDRVQRFQIKVHISSQNLQRELENYTWKKERATGRITDTPIDDWNHGLDAVRYWAMEELQPRRNLNAPRQTKQKRFDPFDF